MALTTLFFAAMIAMLPMASHAGSARMSLVVPGGAVAEADYWPGEAHRPAVLVLHGFLQTRNFPTVRRLAEALADEGYSVLLPSLTLGLNRRQQSLACEAIHTHSMEQDVAEVHAWTEWLAERAGKPPVLIGHSAGGVHLAAMLDTHRELNVQRAVLISLSYFGEEHDVDQLAFLRQRARADLADNASAIRRYALTYCKTYVTTPRDLLSYLQWDKDLLRHALSGSTVPVTVIYGDQDQRIDRQWLEGLREDGVSVRPIAGANHFFDMSHEFDLVDEVLRVMDGGSHG